MNCGAAAARALRKLPLLDARGDLYPDLDLDLDLDLDVDLNQDARCRHLLLHPVAELYASLRVLDTVHVHVEVQVQVQVGISWISRSFCSH